ncbi:putative RNA polymerase II-associated protein 1 [Apostichopus japonicus]|uniref:Putative RNA polymerase II-associated protein 1 n=1 Tax=Stichopus japonicus TaxID=307972 RepID=A0A2G8LMD6_STIJA|nr:putative RNA polymerase II-associated protein 1 [Apostichopus japonicus]
MNPLKRPKAGETQEDLLRQQEEFLAQGGKPAAIVVEKGDKRRKDVDPKAERSFTFASVKKDVVKLEGMSSLATGEPSSIMKKSSQFKSTGNVRGQRVTFNVEDGEDPEEVMDRHDTHITTVLSKIMEAANKAFQQFHTEVRYPPVVSIGGLDGEHAEATDKAIHEENKSKMAAMSEEEILREQARIKAMLDPSLVAFLQKKKRQPGGERKEPEVRRDEEMETNERATEVKPDSNDEVVDMPVKISKNWLNMNKVESDKLLWMKDLPKPAAKDSKGAQARFDFNGRLVAKEANIPVREGLHHHGDEQEIPGYSLEELFTLARSSVLNQRVLSLQTLSRIVYNSRLQELGGDLSEPLLPTLLEAGILFLMRWSIDDTNEGVISAAVEGLAALLVQPGDEDTLDRIYTWYHGNNLPPLIPLLKEEDEELDENGLPMKDEDISDPQMVQRDVIKALLRMNTLRRFCFILDKVRPPAPTVLNILSILIRTSRHSSQAAFEICKCPKLLEVIVREFLPMAGWKQQGAQVADVYGYPVVSALKLLRVLCATGRNRAASLIAQFRLQPLLLRYLSEEPSDMSLDIASAFHISMEAIRLWHTCVEYGQLTEMYSELYPILVQHLQLFQRLSVLPLPATTTAGDETVYRLQLWRTETLILLLEGVVQVAGAAASLHQNSDTSKDVRHPPAVQWGHVTGLHDPLRLCVQRWLGEMSQSPDTVSPQAFAMSASVLNFTASYYENAIKQPSYSPVDCLSQVEELTNQVIIPFMTSRSFQSYLSQIRQYSAFEGDEREKLQLIQSLPDFGCHPDNQDLMHPAVQKNSSHCFLLALFRLVHSVICVHRGIGSKFLPILQCAHVTDCIKSFCHKDKRHYQGVRAVFTRFQLLSVYYLLKAYQYASKHSDTSHEMLTLYHGASLELFSRLQVADYYYAHQVLCDLIFDPDSLWEGKGAETMATELSEKLTLSESVDDPSADGTSLGQLLSEAYRNIPEVRRLYMLYIATDKKKLETSRAEALHQPFLRKSHFLSEMNEPLVPQDWMYLPLLQLFTEQQKVEMLGKTVKSIPVEIVKGMTSALQWLLMMEAWRPTVLANVELAARISRLYCVFLTSSDLFMESTVSALLHALLKIYTQPGHLSCLNFDISIPGVSSFYDLSQLTEIPPGKPLHNCSLPDQLPALRNTTWKAST